MVALGGRACVIAQGCVWLLQGGCVVSRGACVVGGHACPGGVAKKGACMAKGACMCSTVTGGGPFSINLPPQLVVSRNMAGI